ncbi:hypothetical protein, partial [Nocardia farcinica]
TAFEERLREVKAPLIRELEAEFGLELVGFDTSDVRPQTVRDFADEYRRHYDEFGGTDVTKIVIAPFANDETFAMIDFTDDGMVLLWNERYAINRALFRYVTEENVDSGYHAGPRDEPIGNTISHELGHAIANYPHRDDAGAGYTNLLERYSLLAENDLAWVFVEFAEHYLRENAPQELADFQDQI